MNYGATAAFNTLRRSGSAARDCDDGFTAGLGGLIWHVCLALIVPRRLRLRGRVGRWFRFEGRRLGSGLRSGVVLRRRRDDHQRRVNKLAAGWKWRGKDDQRKTSGKSNAVGLQGRVPCLRFAAARPIDAPARRGNLIWSRRKQFAHSRRALRVQSRFPV
jgi:hypothetical protein